MRPQKTPESIIEWSKVLASAILGVLCLVIPLKISGVVGLLFGLFLIISGLIRMFSYFLYGKNVHGALITLVEAFLMQILGSLFMALPQLFLSIISIVVGLYFIVDGFFKYSQTLLNRKTHKLSGREIAVAILEVIQIVVGLVLLLVPGAGNVLMIMLFGIILIINGAHIIIGMSNNDNSL